MKLRSDGSVQSSATPTPENLRSQDFALYRGLVTRIIYVDDPANITKNSQNPRVLYECIVLGGFASGQVISNCRLSSDLGGESGYFERTLRAASNSISGGRLSEADGDIVFIQFVQGHTGYPVIVALDHGIHTADKIGAKLSEGPRSVRQFNGVRETINKDGELILQVHGGSAVSEKGRFDAAATPLVTTTVSKDEKLIRTFKSGLNITEDGVGDKVTITTKSGVTVTIDGAGNKVILAKGATIIELDGNGDKISLKGGFVDLGASVSDFAVLFNELLSTFNSHTHPFAYSAGPSPAIGVSNPPTAPMLQTVGSQTVKVQP